jgi:hypothetical protein
MQKKIKLSKYRVYERLDQLKLSKEDLRIKLGISTQGIYYRFLNGWRKSDALYLANMLKIDVEKLEAKDGR